MIVDVDPELRLVTLRHATSDLVLRLTLLLVVGIGAPAWAQRAADVLLVPALVLTGATALWLARWFSEVLVLDEDGVECQASRRGRRRVAWDDVEALRVEDGRVRTTTADGRSLQGPPADDAVLAEARRAATELELLPDRLR